MNERNIEQMKKEQGVVVERFFNVRYAFFFALFLSLGCLLSYFMIMEQASGWWAFFLVPIPVGALLLSSSKKKTLIALFAFALAFVVGIAVFQASVNEYTNSKVYDGEYTVAGTVQTKTQKQENTTMLLSDVKIGENGTDFKLVAYLSPSFAKKIELGDRLVLRGYVRTKRELSGDYGFAALEIADGIRYFCNYPTDVQIVGNQASLSLLVRARLEEVICAGMNEDAAPLTLALLLGDTASIQSDLLDNIRAGGIAHIFAVSGLHIAALYAFCRLISDKTKFSCAPSWVRFLFVATLVIFYGSVCGFSSSVLRAIVMCLTAYLCRLVWINYDMLDSLGLSAAVVLVLFPTLLFDIGFQLSFLACIGIGLLSGVLRRAVGGDGEWISRLLAGKKELEYRALIHKTRLAPGILAQIWRWFAGVFSLTIAAQAGTFPVQLNAFGFVSGWGLLLNVFFVPIVGGCFAFLLALVCIASILPVSLAGILLYLPSLVWSALMLVFEAVDFSSFAVRGSMSFGATLCFYMLVVVFSDKLNCKLGRWISVGVCSLVLAGLSLAACLA